MLRRAERQEASELGLLSRLMEFFQLCALFPPHLLNNNYLSMSAATFSSINLNLITALLDTSLIAQTNELLNGLASKPPMYSAELLELCSQPMNIQTSKSMAELLLHHILTTNKHNYKQVSHLLTNLLSQSELRGFAQALCIDTIGLLNQEPPKGALLAIRILLPLNSLKINHQDTLLPYIVKILSIDLHHSQASEVKSALRIIRTLKNRDEISSDCYDIILCLLKIIKSDIVNPSAAKIQSLALLVLSKFKIEESISCKLIELLFEKIKELMLRQNYWTSQENTLILSILYYFQAIFQQGRGDYLLAGQILINIILPLILVNQTELDLLRDDPQEFVLLSQDCAFTQESEIPKAKAFHLLEVMCAEQSQYLLNFCIYFLRALDSSLSIILETKPKYEPDGQQINESIEIIPQYKADACLLAICALSPYIKKREDVLFALNQLLQYYITPLLNCNSILILNRLLLLFSFLLDQFFKFDKYAYDCVIAFHFDMILQENANTSLALSASQSIQAIFQFLQLSEEHVNLISRRFIQVICKSSEFSLFQAQIQFTVLNFQLMKQQEIRCIFKALVLRFYAEIGAQKPNLTILRQCIHNLSQLIIIPEFGRRFIDFPESLSPLIQSLYQGRIFQVESEILELLTTTIQIIPSLGILYILYEVKNIERKLRGDLEPLFKFILKALNLYMSIIKWKMDSSLVIMRCVNLALSRTDSPSDSEDLKTSLQFLKLCLFTLGDCMKISQRNQTIEALQRYECCQQVALCYLALISSNSQGTLQVLAERIDLIQFIPLLLGQVSALDKPLDMEIQVQGFSGILIYCFENVEIFPILKQIALDMELLWQHKVKKFKGLVRDGSQFDSEIMTNATLSTFQRALLFLFHHCPDSLTREALGDKLYCQLGMVENYREFEIETGEGESCKVWRRVVRVARSKTSLIL